MNQDVSGHFFRSIRRGYVSGSIAALLAAMAFLGFGSAEAQEMEGGQANFWLGQTSGLWTQRNWASNMAGAPTISVPNSTNNVTFSATGARNENTTLGGNFTIRSLTINDPAAVTISAPGALTISGLSGTGITINSGAGLFTMNANLALAGASNTILVNNAAGAVVNGVISGSNGLIKIGIGVLTLTGANTFTGPVGIGGGVLQIINDNDLGASSNSVYLYNNAMLRVLANVTSNRALILAQIPGLQPGAPGGGIIDTNGFSLTWNGVISGSGQLTKTGLGILTLTATNTYQGGTFVTGGLINFASLANFGSGNITLNGGGLQWAVGNTVDVSGILNPFGSGGATLDTNGNNVTLAAPLTGPGGLTKQGAGALTLLGTSTYAGNTIVSAGSLLVDGSIASANTYVQPGALIGGQGTIKGNLFNGGTVSPGDAPGALTIGGNYTQSPAGALLIRIGGPSPLQHDLLAVGGIANLAGALQIQQLNNFKFSIGQTVTFLTASGGVSGQFSSVIDPFATGSGTLVGVDVVYLSNSVGLEAVQLPLTSIPGETPNEQAVARALDQVLGDPHFAKLFAHLDNEPLGKVLNDLDRLGPEELTSVFAIGIAQAEVQTFNLQRRLEDVRWGSNGFSASGFAMNGATPGYSGPLGDPGFLEGSDGKSGKSALAPAPDNRLGVFITGSGEFTSLGDTDNARGYGLTSAGFTLGIDYRVTDHFVIGLATGYDRSDADLVGGGRVTVDGGKLALYGTCFTGKGLYADVAVQGGYNSYDTSRVAVDGSSRGTTDGGELNVLFGTGYEWKIGGLTFGPTANFEYSYIGVNGSDERGSLAPLDLSNQSQDSLRSTFGAKVSYDWKIGGVTVVPELRLGWQHEYGDNTFQFQSQFEEGGPSFNVQGPATGRDSLIVGAGFAVRWNDRISSYVYYDGELGRTNYESNNVSGGFRIEF